MRTRLVIHTEQIEIAGEHRHFLFQLPPDCEKVLAIKTIATPQITETLVRHIQAGQLRISRDGMLLYETEVRHTALIPELPAVYAPSVIEQGGRTFIAGTKNDFEPLHICTGATALMCSYVSNNSFADYSLKIILQYQSSKP